MVNLLIGFSHPDSCLLEREALLVDLLCFWKPFKHNRTIQHHPCITDSHLDASSPSVPGIVVAVSENETRPSTPQTLRHTNAFWYRVLDAGKMVGFGNNGGTGITCHCLPQSTCCVMSTYYVSCPPLHVSEWTSRLLKGSRWDRKFSSIFANSFPEEMVQVTRWQKARHTTEDVLYVVWESVWAPPVTHQDVSLVVWVEIDAQKGNTCRCSTGSRACSLILGDLS